MTYTFHKSSPTHHIVQKPNGSFGFIICSHTIHFALQWYRFHTQNQSFSIWVLSKHVIHVTEQRDSCFMYGSLFSAIRWWLFNEVLFRFSCDFPFILSQLLGLPMNVLPQTGKMLHKCRLVFLFLGFSEFRLSSSSCGWTKRDWKVSAQIHKLEQISITWRFISCNFAARFHRKLFPFFLVFLVITKFVNPKLFCWQT